MEMLSILGVIGPIQIVLILVFIILFFGGKKIPGLVKGVMQGIKDFKKEIKEEPESKDSSGKIE
jgi:sec-independent protein translocase protein TatA